MDLACSAALGLVLAVLVAAYLVRVARLGRARSARVDAEGKSALVSSSVMEMLYWSARPLVALLVRLGVTPDMVTYASLALGVAAGGALGAGHFGLGALLAAAAGAGDALDGVLARQLGTASQAGEVLDAAVDRYVDFALLGGLAFHFRLSAPKLVLALLALLAAIMVSYSTAKAESLAVVPPRGSMRRVERAVLVIMAAALTPAVARLGATWEELPILLALGAIAVVGNESAVHRLAVVRARVREREGAARASRALPHEPAARASGAPPCEPTTRAAR